MFSENSLDTTLDKATFLTYTGEKECEGEVGQGLQAEKARHSDLNADNSRIRKSGI